MAMITPNELIAQIVSNITDRGTLLNLLLVSRGFQHEAERAIYHTLHYDKMSSQLKETLSDHSSHRCQRIAPLVRGFTFNSGYNPDLRRILENLFNLHTLYLYHFPLIGDLLRGCSFRLQMLLCCVPYDADWLQFLQTQTELIKLIWYDPNPGLLGQINVQLPIFPKLRVLGGSAAITRSLLPTHPSITNLSLSVQGVIGPSPFLGIQALSLISFAPQHFRVLANQFPNLRYLHGRICPEEMDWPFDINVLAGDFIACVDGLKHLQKLQLWIDSLSTSEKEFLASKLMDRHAGPITLNDHNDLDKEWWDLSWANGTGIHMTLNCHRCP